jgi:hypothetical protein
MLSGTESQYYQFPEELACQQFSSCFLHCYIVPCSDALGLALDSFDQKTYVFSNLGNTNSGKFSFCWPKWFSQGLFPPNTFALKEFKVGFKI